MRRFYHHNLLLEVLLHLAELATEKDINRKRYQDLSDESENMEDSEKSKLIGKKLTKKIHLASEETSEGSEVENKRSYKRSRSSDEISSVSDLISGESCGEYISRVRRKARKYNRNYEHKKIARKLEKQNMDEKEESITKLGNDESEEDEENVYVQTRRQSL